MRVTTELSKARIALCAESKEQRQNVLGEDQKAKDMFMSLWNQGVVCGRCQHFNSLGRDYSGLCGTCSVVPKCDYTRPEEFCNLFNKRESIS